MEKENNAENKPFELTVALSYKVRKGSIKVSDKDLGKIGVGMVDDVVVTPVGKDEGVTEMLFSDSKIKSGNVIFNVNDARVIEVEEGDKVIVERLAVVQSPRVNKKTTPSKANEVPSPAFSLKEDSNKEPVKEETIVTKTKVPKTE